MTWLSGQTTLGNLADLITQLACGEAADDTGTTVAAAHKWRRIDAFNSMCTPTSEDVALTTHGYRAGYFAALHGGNGHCLVKSAYTTATPIPGAGRRRVLTFYVYKSNSVAGNYSDLRISRVGFFDPERGGANPPVNQTPNDAIMWNSQSENGTATTWGVAADGTCVMNSAFWGYNESVTVQFGSASGIVSTGYYWRYFDLDNAPYGVDHIPMLPRRSPGVAVSFPAAPSGVQGTDWVLQEHANTWNTLYNLGSQGTWVYGSAGYGVGWKTLPDGSRYTVSLTVAACHARIMRSASGGQLDLWLAPSKLSQYISGQYCFLGGVSVATWARYAYDPAQTSTSMPVQYWMRVTNRGIVLVFNGDPGQAGKLGTAIIGCYDSAQSSWDPFPWYCNLNPASGLSTNNSWGGQYLYQSAYTLYSQRIRALDMQSRDWQHGWGRCDINDKYNYASSQWFTGGGSNGVQASVPAREVKPNSPDGVWEMFQIPVSENLFGTNYDPETYIGWDSRFRGWTDPSVLFLPEEGFGSGDILSDPTTGANYFLTLADYPGAMSRQYRYSGNPPRGGAAILEG